MRQLKSAVASAFTLIEVMLAIAFIGIALMALLALHHTDLQSVIRGQDLTRAAMLAQSLMAQAELERFPAVGQKHGDFSQIYPGMFPNFHWQRNVEQSQQFPTIESVRVRVIYGPGGIRHFDLIEFMHNPAPATPTLPTQPGGQPGNPNNPTQNVPGTGAD